MPISSTGYFAHPSSVIDSPCSIGKGTKMWHFCHVSSGATIGRRCILGQNVFVATDVAIGDNVKIQNNVSVYRGTRIEDDVFLGPSCVLTNVTNPRAQVNRHSIYEETIIRRGATIGANATVVCRVEIGRYAFIAAGAVVTKNVSDYALVMGMPARQAGWMSRHGHHLDKPDVDGIMICPESGYRYKFQSPDVVRCLDLDENEPLPEAKATGGQLYRSFRELKVEK